MDGQTILEETPASPPAFKTQPRFPGEDGGHSLAEMAQRDLDAALQLLADRAQYVTGACGAAIALRRNEQTAMVCRASSGSHAPELGTLLSMEHGLSGESVRTLRGLRCDDAATDNRVNREGCLQLGISSVLVVPIVSHDEALGVFELFSAQPHAFDDCDLTALARLSEMVETAIKHSLTVKTTPLVAEGHARQGHTIQKNSIAQLQPSASQATEATRAIPPSPAASPAPAIPPSSNLPADLPHSNSPEKPEGKTPFPPPLPRRPLFWDAPAPTPATRAQPPAVASESEAASQPVPTTLCSFKKCQACGFPVSQGRTFCVECEEKQWHKERDSQPTPR